MSIYSKTIAALESLRTEALANATDPNDIAMIESNHAKALAIALDLKQTLDEAPINDDQNDSERGLEEAKLIMLQVTKNDDLVINRKKLNNVLAKVAIGFTIGLAIVGSVCWLIKRRC